MTRESFVRKLIDYTLEKGEDLPKDIDTYEKYVMYCNMNGIQCSLDDMAFVTWIFGRIKSTEDDDFLALVRNGLWQLRFMNPVKNENHRDLLDVILYDSFTTYQDYYVIIQDYLIKFFPKSELGKKAFRMAKAFGRSDLPGEVFFPELHKVISEILKSK